jgi:hypothetical protein
MVSFQTKNPNQCKLLSMEEDVGIFYVHFVNFPATWHILWLLGTFLPVLVCCTKKNLATLV